MRHAIDVAIGELGVHEATGRNDGIPAERYMNGDELAWCAGFALYCYDVSDDPDIWDDFDPSTTHDERRKWRLRAVKTLMGWARERGVYLGRNVVPARNDLIFYRSRLGSDAGEGWHVGIVEFVASQIDSEGRETLYAHTVEGNLGNAVRRRVVRLDDPRIAGYARFARRTPDALIANT